MRKIQGISGRAAVIAVALCLSSRGCYQSTEPADDTAGIPVAAPVHVVGTIPTNDAAPEEAARPVREPTPCLEARQPDPDAVTDDSDEPSVGLVIFDRSGSMAEGWVQEEEDDPAEAGNKWDAASGALIGAVAPVENRVTLGAIFFPQPDGCLVAPIDDERQVFFRPGPEFITTWEAVVPLNRPDGMTPLESAFIVAETAVEAACVDGLLDRRSFVMVLTDGEPNCDTDMVVVEAIAAKWLEHGIATYVLGLPGSEDAAGVLDRIAEAGGTETLLVPGSPSELEDDISAII
jgi:hypothetical protein